MLSIKDFLRTVIMITADSAGETKKKTFSAFLRLKRSPTFSI